MQRIACQICYCCPNNHHIRRFVPILATCLSYACKYSVVSPSSLQLWSLLRTGIRPSDSTDFPLAILKLNRETAISSLWHSSVWYCYSFLVCYLCKYMSIYFKKLNWFQLFLLLSHSFYRYCCSQIEPTDANETMLQERANDEDRELGPRVTLVWFSHMYDDIYMGLTNTK